MRAGRRTPAVILIICIVLFLLCACSQKPETAPETAAPTAAPQQTPAPTPEPTPEQTPTPTPEPTPEPIREAVLTGESSREEILALRELTSLEYVDAAACTDYDALLALHEALPDCVIDYTVDLGGVTVRSTDASAVLDGALLSPEALIERLAYLPWLREVDICGLGYTNEQSISVADSYPEKDVIWLLHLRHWTMRTDITCFSTLQPWPIPYRYTNDDLALLLKYCTKLVALDLGHNDLTDLEPIGELTRLKVLILGDNPNIKDVSPLGNLTELEYLELFMNDYVSDFSSFASLTKIVDLNIGYYSRLEHLDFLEHMPGLEMGWFVASRVSAEEQAAVKAAHPDATIMFTASRVSSTADGWRATERNIAIRKAFANWQNVVEFRAWDDVEYREGARLYETYALYT